MVLFFTTTLLVSILGLVALILLKRWEMSSGRVVLGSMRPSLGAFLHRVVVFFERVLPALATSAALRLFAALRALLHRAAAWGVLIIERILERVLVGLRRKTSVPHAERERSSDFLREVAEHKKKLQEFEDRAIYED